MRSTVEVFRPCYFSDHGRDLRLGSLIIKPLPMGPEQLPPSATWKDENILLKLTKKRREKLTNKKGDNDRVRPCWENARAQIGGGLMHVHLSVSLAFSVTLIFLRFRQDSSLFQTFQDTPAEYLQC